MTDYELAQACADLYNAARPEQLGGIVYSLQQLGDLTVVVFRGSEVVEDWMDDFNAVPMWDARLGFVHKGFFDGLPAVFEAVKAKLAGRLIITGHSLGGARARDFAGLCAVSGIEVERLVTFGSPRPAYANLVRIIEKAGMAHVSYRNRNDPVPLVPFKLLTMDWEHTEPWTAVDAAPAADDLEPLRDHHIQLYKAGVAQLSA